MRCDFLVIGFIEATDAATALSAVETHPEIDVLLTDVALPDINGRQLADQITKIVKSDAANGWSFAAAADIHGAIVDHLPGNVRDRIVEHVKSDLVKIEPARLHSHFRSLQPI